MFRSIPLGIRSILVKSKYSTQATETVGTQKNDYYKNLASGQEDDSIPPGWEEAQPYESMPGPKPFPVVGNMLRFLPGGELHELKFDQILRDFPKKYGKVVKLGGIVGKADMVFLFEPDDMENILRNAGVFPVRDVMHCLQYYRNTLRKEWFKGYGGLSTEHGEPWYKTRTVVNPILMQPRNIQQYTTKMDDIAKDFIKYIQRQLKISGTNQVGDNFIDDIHKWALESVTSVAINRRLGALENNSQVDKFIQAILRMFDDLYYLEILPPYWKYLPSKKFNGFIENLDFIMNSIRFYIDESLKVDENVTEEEMSVFRRLVKHNKQVAFVMTVDMITAGIDTTGKTMGAALYLLAKNTDKQKLLREEVLKFLPNKDSQLTKDTLAKMSYLKAAIKETFRIAPIGIGNMRTTTKNMVIGGYKIPKNVNVLPIHLYTSFLTDKYFKEPEKFLPERWLRSASDEYAFKNLPQFIYMPFGFGPRSCIGKRLANLEIEVCLANIIRNYEISWEQPDMKFGAKLLYGILDPLKLTLKEVN